MSSMKGDNANTFNCALLGTGRQANRLAEAIDLAGSRVVALYSRDAEKGDRFAKDKGLSTDVIISDDLDSILNHRQVNIVVIATPDFLHYEHAKKALMAGKHVFLEKPLATNYEQGLEMVTLAKDNGLTLAVDYHLRWSPALRQLKHLCDDGYFGKIQKTQIRWGWKPYKTDDWRNSDNPWWVLSLLGTHCIDLVLWIFQPVCGEVQGFQGEKSNAIYNQKNEDYTKLVFPFAPGSVAEITCTLERDIPLTIEISSDNGTFVFDKLTGQEQEISLPGLSEKFVYQNPWAAALVNFFETCAGRGSFEVSPETALENVGYLLKIKQGSRSDEPCW